MKGDRDVLRRRDMTGTNDGLRILVHEIMRSLVTQNFGCGGHPFLQQRAPRLEIMRVRRKYLERVVC
jgi:hypothetical protein